MQKEIHGSSLFKVQLKCISCKRYTEAKITDLREKKIFKELKHREKKKKQTENNKFKLKM